MPNSSINTAQPVYDSQTWREVLAKYHQPRLIKSYWQILNSFIPYIALSYLAYLSLQVSYLLTLLIAIPTAGFLMRIFIIFHDCVHGSFFKSRLGNDFWGIVAGIFTYTPYYNWKRSHVLHHDTSGNLGRRGYGDVWTMTVEEYLKASFWLRLGYRLYRNPLIMFLLGPFYVVLIGNRLPKPKVGWKERYSIHWTNLSIVVLLVAAGETIGLKAFLLIQLPVVVFGFAAGFWLFYVQHQFEGVYWEEQQDWDFVSSALKGSSFYKLPIILQWFSGRIGYHHIHHLCPRIPNYFLVRCQQEHPLFQEVKPITLFSSLKSLSYRLWDQEENRLVSFKHIRKLKKLRPTVPQEQAVAS